MDEAVAFRATDGLEIEGLVVDARDARGVVVFCHPHPRAGGTMNAPLLKAVTDALVAERWSVVRFNFRGIGASEGTPGDGTAEIADARGALSFAKERFGSRPTILAGWSFGASVALRTAAEAVDLAGVVAVAPPVEGRAGYSVGLPDELEVGVPVLVVSAANDKEIEPEQQRIWAERNGAHYVVLRGANHFFWGKYDDLSATITTFVNRLLPQAST